ncbi:MAG: EamA family transporter [Gemmatimonadota bacterium]|jgi:uncharacterized membrane protein
MWFPLALGAAAFSALAETVRKRLMRDMDPLAVAFLTAGASAVTLLPAAAVEGMALPADAFWLALLVSGGINALAAVLIAGAYQVSDLSLVSPLTGLTPVFTLAVAAVVIGEVPSVVGFAGIVTVVVGTYLLATATGAGRPTAPLRALWGDRGARRMLLVAFLYGTSSTFDKVGVLASAPILWAFSVQGTIAVTVGGRVLATEKGRAGLRGLGARSWGLAGLTGLATTIMAISQMTALTVGLAAYVIAVKRVSILLTVLAGGLLFREDRLRTRVVAATVILGGLALLAMG